MLLSRVFWKLRRAMEKGVKEPILSLDVRLSLNFSSIFLSPLLDQNIEVACPSISDF